MKGLGDGLSKLAEVAPIEMRRGERGAMVVEFFVDHVAYPAHRNEWDQEGVARLHVLRAGLVTIVEPNTVRKVLDAHQKKLDEAANRRSLFEAAREAQSTANGHTGEDEGDGAE